MEKSLKEEEQERWFRVMRRNRNEERSEKYRK